MRIALFTSYHPAIGGGAVNFRSLLPHLEGIEVTWFHLGEAQPNHAAWIALGRPPGGAGSIAEWWRTPAMWAGARRGALSRMADRIISGGFDRHWVLAMDEGIFLGLELAIRAPGVPLHVSIQDDQEHALFGRSRRYRWIARLTREPFRQLLQVARSVDVTSDGMQRYYEKKMGIKSLVVHPVVDSVVPHPLANGTTRDFASLRMGHIGTIYSADELRVALAALRDAARELGREPAAHFIGLMPKHRPVVESAGIHVELTDSRPEPEAIAALARCDFVYAMQPFDRVSEVFARTSLPTKLTTYVQSGRPILAQAPADGMLADAVRKFQVGTVCASNDRRELTTAMRSIASDTVAPEKFARWADAWFSRRNATELARLWRAGGRTR